MPTRVKVQPPQLTPQPILQLTVPPVPPFKSQLTVSPPNNAHPESHVNPTQVQAPLYPLPSPSLLSNPSFSWGEYDHASIKDSLEEAYSEVVHWRKNTFQVPFGNAGKGFVAELSRLYKAYADGSALEAIALKACTVMSILLLQKPFRSSKRKDHSACLARRMSIWKKGDIRNLLVEGRSLQSRLPKFSPSGRDDLGNLARTFSKLMFQGKTNAALRQLSQQGMSGTLRTDDMIDLGDDEQKSVMDILKSKHPPAQPASPDALPQGITDPPDLPPVVFDQITASSIRCAALRTKGAAGPSGIDAHGWRRLCTSFKSASHDLCHALAAIAKRLCTTFVAPEGIAPLLACRLIALDKCPGVRPIGICETPRRIIAKAVLFATKGDLQDAAGPKQLCAGQIAGIEAAVHAMRSIFSSEDTEAILLVDASNAFNSLNRQVALHNIRHLCPSLANILINTYREPSELFIDGQVIWSEEGTTQGDPLAMPLYALATIPLINRLSSVSDTKQVWYADDASAAGQLSSLRSWWDNLQSLGPSFGYYANARKTWLITKEQHLSQARELFQDAEVNITSQGRPYLGAALGSEEFSDQFVKEKVKEWQEELILLANIATSQPHATFAAFIHGFVHKFTYLSRTTPIKDPLLQPLEDIIKSQLIPAWTGRAPPNDLERELFALPAHLGGLGIINPASRSSKEFQASVSISAPLSHLIESQQPDYPWETLDAQVQAKETCRKQRQEDLKSSAANIKSTLSDSLKLAVDLAQEKGASTWLTSLPLEEFGFSLHKGAFRDALALRYGWLPSNTPINCACGTHFTVEHSLSCPKGGFPSIRHNEVRDTVSCWMSEVCSDVCIEPTLQPITGETLRGASAITEDGARLDIAANGFWGGRYERAYFDVRVFNPHAPSNRQQCLASTYRKHERIKIRAYEQRVREVEHGSFTPLVMSLSGGCGNAANVCYKRLASMLAEKRDQPYSNTLAWMRCKLSFALLRSTIQCIRGARSAGGRAFTHDAPPTDLVVAESNIST